MASTVRLTAPGVLVGAVRTPPPSGPTKRTVRFPTELWVLCFIVSLGAVQSIPLGFYQFRLSDLILDLGVLYCARVHIRGRLTMRIRVLLAAYITTLIGRILYESLSVEPESMRTLLGMGAAYAAPFIFFAVREAQASRRLLWTLLFLACVISLLSQMGLLGYGESYAAGAIDLSRFLGIARRTSLELDYVEATITIWRALSVGLTLAAVVARTGFVVKAFGVVGFVLQFTGGGGSRSQLLFLILAPLLMFLRPGRRGTWKNVVRLPVALATAGLFAVVYLWAPVKGDGLVKGVSAISHYDRATEIVTVFTGGRTAAAETSGGGFDGRVSGWETYWTGIMTGPKVFWFGTGLSFGAAFRDTANILAHNPILDVWALSGLIGLVFFLCFVALVVLDLRLLLSVTPRGGADELIGLSVAGAIMYMFQWLFFQAVTADRSFMIVFYLLSGLMLPTTRLLAYRVSQRSGQQPVMVRPTLRGVAAG